MKSDLLAEVAKEMGHATPTITYQTSFKWVPKEARSDINELDDQAQWSATYPQPK